HNQSYLAQNGRGQKTNLASYRTMTTSDRTTMTRWWPWTKKVRLSIMKNREILILYLDLVDCAIQVNPGDDLKKGMPTNISMKLSSKDGKKVSNKSSSSRQYLNRESHE